MSENLNIMSLLHTGVKAETKRQNTIASNVANMETPGYKRLSVKFEEALNKAIKNNEDDFESMEIPVCQPQNTPVKANGNDVSLNTEVTEMVKNNLRHKTYTYLLKTKYTQIKQAINTQG